MAVAAAGGMGGGGAARRVLGRERGKPLAEGMREDWKLLTKAPRKRARSDQQ